MECPQRKRDLIKFRQRSLGKQNCILSKIQFGDLVADNWATIRCWLVVQTFSSILFTTGMVRTANVVASPTIRTERLDIN